MQFRQQTGAEILRTHYTWLWGSIKPDWSWRSALCLTRVAQEAAQLRSWLLAPVCMEADTNSWISCNTKDIEKSVFYTEGFSSPCSLLFIRTIWPDMRRLHFLECLRTAKVSPQIRLFLGDPHRPTLQSVPLCLSTGAGGGRGCRGSWNTAWP